MHKSICKYRGRRGCVDSEVRGELERLVGESVMGAEPQKMTDKVGNDVFRAERTDKQRH